MEIKRKPRVLIACNRCKVKKRKCDQEIPCNNCIKSGSICQFDKRVQDLEVQELRAQIEALAEHNRNLQTQLNSVKTQQFNEQDDNFLSESTFAEILTKIMYRGSEEEEYIGNFAVISIVRAIRKNLLGGEIIDDVSSNIILDNSLEEDDCRVNHKVESEFLDKFFSLSHNRCYLIDHVWFKQSMAKPILERTSWEMFCYNIALGIGCRLTELLKVTIYPPPEVYFRRALKKLVDADMNPTRQIQSCLLIAVFINRSYHLSFYVSSWELTGLAIRKLIQYGFHRKQPITLEHCWEYEVRKRLFWSAYNNDKLLSLSLGRPFVYFDTFIDLPYPLSIDFADEPTNYDYSVLYQLQLNQENGPSIPQPISCFTSIITTSKIRLIESRIHLLLFSVNDSIPTADNLATITRDLDKWLAELPPRDKFEAVLKGKESYDFFELLYHRAKLLLLIPIIIKRARHERQDLLDQVNKSAGCICINYKNLYNEAILEFSIVALHTVFLAGVTLVFCLKHKGSTDSVSIHQGIRACSSMLYVFSERWIEARTYRDLFDNLLDLVTSREAPEEVTHDTKTFNEDFWDQILEGLGGDIK